MMWHYSNEEERRNGTPEAILTEIGLKAGMTFLDIGCGDGFFALPSAEMVVRMERSLGWILIRNRNARTRAQERGLTILPCMLQSEEVILCHCADGLLRYRFAI
jgi:cyclopropane fatty-acyl-phospholipid synthase-like methyltransferase